MESNNYVPNSAKNNYSKNSLETHPTAIVKSLESGISVKMVLHNQSNRKVHVNWIDYEGKEVRYFPLGPQCKYVVDTYVTHPWLFRDIKRKNLAIFDALIADRRDLVALHQWNKYSERKRFQVASRVLFPIQHKTDEFVLVVIKNGVYSLQENCLNTLIEMLKNPLNEKKQTIVLKFLPKHLRENFIAHFEQGQNFMEFLDSK